jgi:hypothetical protein
MQVNDMSVSDPLHQPAFIEKHRHEVCIVGETGEHDLDGNDSIVILPLRVFVRDPHGSHAAFADLQQQLVATEACSAFQVVLHVWRGASRHDPPFRLARLVTGRNTRSPALGRLCYGDQRC